jgi:hypothetical protein
MAINLKTARVTINGLGLHGGRWRRQLRIAARREREGMDAGIGR